MATSYLLLDFSFKCIVPWHVINNYREKNKSLPPLHTNPSVAYSWCVQDRSSFPPDSEVSRGAQFQGLVEICQICHMHAAMPETFV